MTIEATLDRIAVALEKIAAGSGTVAAVGNAGTEPPKQTRGRPAKGEKDGVATQPEAQAVKTETPAATPAAEEADPFATETPAAAKAPTRDDVRAALVAAQKRLGSPEKARGILKTAGNVDALVALPEAKFAAVIAAANAAGV